MPIILLHTNNKLRIHTLHIAKLRIAFPYASISVPVTVYFRSSRSRIGPLFGLGDGVLWLRIRGAIETTRPFGAERFFGVRVFGCESFLGFFVLINLLLISIEVLFRYLSTRMLVSLQY
jgi:hypothetical protein